MARIVSRDESQISRRVAENRTRPSRLAATNFLKVLPKVLVVREQTRTHILPQPCL